MVKRDGLVDKLRVTADGTGVVGHAGSALLAGTADRVGLTAALSVAITLGGYVKRLRDRAPELFASGRPVDYEHTVATVWQLSFEQLEDGPTAGELLGVCAQLAAERIPRELLRAAGAHMTSEVYGYSFILTDIHDQAAVWVEHFHRHRAQIEERLKDAKLGQALRRMPCADQNANRTWMAASLLALNLTALICDLCPAAGASGKAPADAPLRRTAKTLRRLLFRVPARVSSSARQTILHLPAGYRHASILSDTYHAALSLPET